MSILCYSGYIPVDRYGIMLLKGGDAMEIALKGSQKS